MRTRAHRICATSESLITTRRARRRPGLTCTICRHEQRYEIELALVSGVSRRAVGRRFKVSPDSAWRHLRRHVDQQRRAQLVAGPLSLQQLAEKATAEGMSLVDYLSLVRATLMARFLAAADCGDNQNVAMLGGRITECLRLVAQVTGELSKATATITNNTLVMSSPIMADLQAMLIRTLQPYPEARAAVLSGLAELSARALSESASSAPAGLIEARPGG
jgi:hypothetical protein